MKTNRRPIVTRFLIILLLLLPGCGGNADAPLMASAPAADAPQAA